MKQIKEFLTDTDLLSMPRKQLVRLFREEQKKSVEYETKYNRLYNWLKNFAEFTTGPIFNKNGEF